MKRAKKNATLRLVLLALLAAIPLQLTAAGERPGLKKLRSPIISPGGGEYGLNDQVIITIRSEAGSHIVYTLDGTLPSESGGTHVPRNALTLTLPSGDVTVRAVAVRDGFERSVIRKAVFTRTGAMPKIPAP